MNRLLLRDFISSHRAWLLPLFALIVAYLLYPHLRQESHGEGVEEIVYWTPGEASDAMRVAVEEFERRHPQYKVFMGTATVRHATGDPTRFLLGVAGDVPPDLIYFDRFAVVEWASRGAFEDLSPFLAADHEREDGVHPEHFYRPAWDEAVYRGKVYAIPNTVDTRAMYYQRDALIRAGLVYEPDDQAVRQGRARAGAARPPQTWEQLCRKLVHAKGRVTPDGVVKLEAWVRRPAVNEGLPPDRRLDVRERGVKAGDVLILIADSEVFRGRVGQVLGPDRVKLDLHREQPEDRTAVPGRFVGGACEIKIFDQDSYVVRLTRFDPNTGALKTAGFLPLFGNSWLYMYGWLNGARFMTPDGKKCLLDSPQVVAALQYMTDVYDSLGGMVTAQTFQNSLASSPMDPFLLGKIVLRIDGDGFLRTISAFKPDMSFGAIGSPIPEKRMAAGDVSIGWMGGWAYAIPATAQHKDAAWALLRWLCSIEANEMMADFQASLAKARGQIFFPTFHPDRRVMNRLQQKYVRNNPAVPPDTRQAFQTFVDLLPTSKYRPVTPVGQELWTEHRRATDAAIRHMKQPYDALNYGKRRIDTALEEYFNPPPGPRVPWGRIVVAYVLGITALFGTMIGYQALKRRCLPRAHRDWLEGYLCASPWLVGFVVFGGGPIVFSLIISFSQYDVLNPATFVGLANYIQLLGIHYDDVVDKSVANDPLFWRCLGNTVFMIIGVPLGMIAGLALALLLNTSVRGLALFRTIYYLPAVVPAVAGFILWLWIFDPARGLLNQVLRFVGISDPPHWLQDPTWAKPALIVMGLWGAGSGMIIWLAGLREIPESLYEAARIDGASRGQQFWHVTIPLLTPYIFFNLLMGLIGVFQIFEAAYIMTDGGPADATLFYAYKLFNEAFRFLNMGIASAMAWILFVIVLFITLLQLWLGKKWVYYER